MLPILYFSLLVVCWLYAMFRGGAPERVGATILAIGSFVSISVVSGPANRFGAVETGVFLADVATLAGFLILALHAERYWPLWLAAFQAIGTAGHAVKLVDPGTVREAYAFILAFWSYPLLFLIALGTYRHQQRLARFGVDRSWSNFSSRSARPPAGGPTS
jgi:hypothetical protein